MNEILTVVVQRIIGIASEGEVAGDLKRIYSNVPVTVRVKRNINEAIDTAQGDFERIYKQGGLIVSALRKINATDPVENLGDIKRNWISGGLVIKAHRLIDVPIDNEAKGDFLRICFVTLEHMVEEYPIILTVEQPYGIPWMQNEIVHSAWCWKITRKDGVVLGFTSHDADIEYNGTVYKAATGFAPSAVSTTGDMSVDNLDAEGMLRSDSLTAEDLRKGIYTNAAIEVFLINYQNLKDEVFLMRRGVLGEVNYGKNGFKAEIRGLIEIYL